MLQTLVGTKARNAVRLLIVLSSTVAGLTLSKTSLAYNLLGQTWSGQPTSGCCGSFTMQFNWVGVLEPRDLQAASYGLGNWSSYNGVGSNVDFYIGSSTVLSIQDTSNSGVGWDGITSYSYDSNNHFTSVAVTMNAYYTVNYTFQDTIGVAAHEAGHSFGLAHATGCVLMVADTPSRSACGVWTPQTDDLNGAKALY